MARKSECYQLVVSEFLDIKAGKKKNKKSEKKKWVHGWSNVRANSIAPLYERKAKPLSLVKCLHVRGQPLKRQIAARTRVTKKKESHFFFSPDRLLIFHLCEALLPTLSPFLFTGALLTRNFSLCWASFIEIFSRGQWIISELYLSRGFVIWYSARFFSVFYWKFNMNFIRARATR